MKRTILTALKYVVRAILFIVIVLCCIYVLGEPTEEYIACLDYLLGIFFPFWLVLEKAIAAGIAYACYCAWKKIGEISCRC